MTIHNYPLEFPTLVPLSHAATSFNGEALVSVPDRPLPRELIGPQPVALCILDHHGKPHEARYLDLSQCADISELTTTATALAGDGLALVVWPPNTVSPLQPAVTLLKQMLVQHALGRMADPAFLATWVKEARRLVADYHDIDELLAFEEPPAPASVDEVFDAR